MCTSHLSLPLLAVTINSINRKHRRWVRAVCQVFQHMELVTRIISHTNTNNNIRSNIKHSSNIWEATNHRSWS